MSDATKRPREDEDLRRRVIEQIDALDAEGKRRVLDFSRELADRGPSGAREPRPVGETGGALLAFAGTIDREDLEEIRRAVDEDCEKIDEEGW
ncbi:MAG: hypothetical protein L0G70_07750 [Rubrobacter sp.]|nr:hypothetical protein [Rubrobacter sp.]